MRRVRGVWWVRWVWIPGPETATEPVRVRWIWTPEPEPATEPARFRWVWTPEPETATEPVRWAWTPEPEPEPDPRYITCHARVATLKNLNINIFRLRASNQPRGAASNLNCVFMSPLKYIGLT